MMSAFFPVSPSGRNPGDKGNESWRSKHTYCVGTSQKPSATRVAGMYAWNQLGRRVNKGEKGIRILAPMTGVRRKVAGGYRSQDALHRTRKSVGERILRKL